MRTALMLVVVALSLAANGTDESLEHRVSYWADGTRRSSGTYLNDVRHGEYRTWRQDGTLYELRHYVQGREEGVQQSWDDAGALFLNYEVRQGRRYGFVNAVPCPPAHGPDSEEN